MRTLIGSLLLAGAALAQNQVEIFTVEASGGGWGAQQRVRAALTSIDGVAKLIVGGDRATFTVRTGVAVTRATVARAIEAAGMRLDKFHRATRPRPEAAYVLGLSGVGWASSAARVRATLLTVPGVVDAYVGRPTIVHADRALDKAALEAALKPAGIGINALARDDDHLWPAPRRLRVAVVLYPGVELLDWAGPAEVFSADPRFEVYTVALTKTPVPIQRLPSPVVPTHAVADCPAPDVLVVPGGVGANLKPLLPWIEATLPKTAHVLTVCNAALEFADRRLLDGLDVTTHRGCVDGLRRRAPTARVHADRRWVDSGRIVTAAGVSAGIDGALRIVARTCGDDAAGKAARFLQYDAWDPAAGLVVAR